MTLVRALFTRRAACAHCGSSQFRASRHSLGSLSEALGLAAGRCLSCGRRFVLPRRLLAHAAALAPDGVGPLMPPRAAPKQRSLEEALRMAGLLLLLVLLLLAGILAVSRWEPQPKARRSPRSALPAEVVRHML